MRPKLKFVMFVVLLLSTSVIICLNLNKPKVRENSRRINTNPEHLKRQAEVLRLYSEGHFALYHKKYILAEKKLRQSIAIDDAGGEPLTWADLGRVLDDQGRAEESYAAYQEAYDNPTRGGYSNFPNDVETLTQYGVMCENHGQHDAAVRAYNKSVDELNPRLVPLKVPSDPNKTSLPRLRALLATIRGLTIEEEKNMSGGRNRSSEALEAFQEAAQAQPNDPRVQFYLGYGYRKAELFIQAQAAFQKAALLDKEGTVKAAAEENLRGVQAHRR